MIEEDPYQVLGFEENDLQLYRQCVVLENLIEGLNLPRLVNLNGRSCE